VKHGVRHEASEAGSAGGAQHQRPEPDRRSSAGHGEEVGVEDDARGRGQRLVRDHGLEDGPEGRRPVGLHGGVHGLDDVDDVPGRRDVGRDAVGDRHELELPVARGVRRVEARVEHGHREPPRVQHVAQLQHRVDVALERQREHQDAPRTPPP